MLLLFDTSSNRDHDHADCEIAVLPLTRDLGITLRQLLKVVRTIADTPLDFQTLTLADARVFYLAYSVADTHFTALPDNGHYCLHQDVDAVSPELATSMAYHALESDGTQVWWTVGHRHDPQLTISTHPIDITTLLTLIQAHAH